MVDRRRRTLNTTIRFGVFVVAVATTASQAPAAFRHLPREDVIALALALVLYTLLASINIPLDSHASARKPGTEPGRITLELPLILTIVAVYGPVIAATLTLIAYPIAAGGRGGKIGLFRRLFQGAPLAILWLFAGTVRRELYPGHFTLSITSYLAFVAFYVLMMYMFLYGVWTPLRMLATQTSLRRLWRNLSRDSRLMLLLLLLTSWGYVCTIGWSQIGIAFGLASLAPLPFLAIALRKLHENQIELHRLRLARDAVQAMLGAGDPLPQMNSLLASLHTPAAHETLEIYAAISPNESRLSPLAEIGPHPTAEQMELSTRALHELNRSDSPAITVRNNAFFVFGHAARSSDDALLGALLVHRPIGNAQFVDRKRMADAAADLAPLLRDFRSIAATQTAAALDMLTGMPNRRTIMQLLRDRVDNVAIGSACAVFLLDIDRFKSINDALGHQAGDRCLRSIGQTITRSIRSNDRAGRIGGEEFLILMPDTNAETAVAIGERLRGAIAQLEIRHADGENVTASIGVAVATISDTVESLLARADNALYKAKRQGRNRVVQAPE